MKKKLVGLVTVLAIAAASITGCGKSSTTDTGNNDTTSTTITESKSPTAKSETKAESAEDSKSENDTTSASGHVVTEVNIGYVDGTGSGVRSDTLGVARDYGFLDEEFEAIGVKINWFPMSGAGPAINEAFASGSLDIANYGDVPLVLGRANGLDTQLIAVNGRINKASVVASKDSGIRTVSDLRGKTVATQKGAFMHKVLLDVLAANNLTIEDINFVNVTGTEANTMLLTGDADAVITSGSGLIKLVNEGYTVVVDYREHPEFWQNSGSAARTEFINENPDIIKAYLRALIKAAKYEQDNPEIQVTQFETTGQSKEDFEYLYNNYDYYWSVAPAEGELEGFGAVLAFLIDNDLITEDKKYDIDEWVNKSFYEEAFEELGDDYRTIYTDR